jgi:hypothetical protein
VIPTIEQRIGREDSKTSGPQKALISSRGEIAIRVIKSGAGVDISGGMAEDRGKLGEESS